MTGTIKTTCPECGAENRVEVVFPVHNQGFSSRDFDCLRCGAPLTVTDPHRYNVDGTIEEPITKEKKTIVRISMKRMNESVINRMNHA